MGVIQLLRRTAAQWTANNSSLSRYEIGLETDTGKFKIGDGSTPWADLPYASDGPGAVAFTDLTDAPNAYAGFGNRVPSVKSDESGIQFSQQLYLDPDNGGAELVAGADGILLQASENGKIRLNVDGTSFIRFTTDASALEVNSDGSVNLELTSLTVNAQPAVATQSVLVVGVGTLEFTHGLLTGFTPA